MNTLEFWQYKVLQTLHDPIDKMIVAGRLKQKEAAKDLLKMVTGQEQRLPFLAPDFLASGADRPVVGDGSKCRVDWRLDPIITHPLQPGAGMYVEWDVIPTGKGSNRRAEDLDAQVRTALESLALSSGEWSDPSRVRRLFLRLWRQLPEVLKDLGFQYPYLPAESRVPDHSIWDHTRVASASAFLVEYSNKGRPPEREPWMLAVTLGGVQRFLSEARTTRDLWTASMIYADLAWAAMYPVVEKLGSDAVLYPDLRGNPAADRWLLDESSEAAPEPVRRTGATSFAAMLPNTFVVLAPRGGGDSGLPDLKQLAEECTAAVRDRWRALADAVERWLVKRPQPGNGPWREIWRRQVDGRLGEPPVTWAAIPWPRRMHGIGDAVRGAAIPGQSPGAAVPKLPDLLVQRKRELAPWLPHRIWRHYEMARDVFWHTDTEAGKNYLTNERGFDYPLVHHQLRTVLAMCKAQGAERVAEEPGEKCSMSGREEALTNGAQGGGPLVARQRAGARRLWSGLDVQGTGVERLGSTATIKRFLVPAGEHGSEEQLQAGELVMTDARLLAFPVRSLQAPFFWVTCSMVIQRWARNRRLMGLDVTSSAAALTGDRTAVSDAASGVGSLILEDVFCEKVDWGNVELAGIAESWSRLLPTDEEFSRQEIRRKLVCIPDVAFQHLVRRTTPVAARIQLTGGKTTGKWFNEQTGKNESGNLWYEETLPSDCLFSALVTSRSRGHEAPRQFKQLIGRPDIRVIQVGGNETIGQGFCWWSVEE